MEQELFNLINARLFLMIVKLPNNPTGILEGPLGKFCCYHLKRDSPTKYLENQYDFSHFLKYLLKDNSSDLHRLVY